MRNAAHLLAQYAAYQRDRRNIATLFVGVPLIVFAVGELLAGVTIVVHGVAVTAAWIAFGPVALPYPSRGFVLGPAISAVVADWLFMLAWNRAMQLEIEADVGPTVIRDAAQPA